MPRAQAVATDEQLRARRDERVAAAPHAEDVALAEGLAQDAQDGGSVVRRGRVHLHLPCEHDLLQVAGADPLDGAGDRARVVLGRHRADDAVTRRRVRVEQRQRALRPVARRAAPAPRRPCRRRRPAGRARRASAAPSSPRRTSATCGTCSEAGAKPPQCGERPPVRGECEPADRHRARAARQVRRVAHRPRGEVAPLRSDGREPFRAGGLQCGRAAEAREREAHRGPAARRRTRARRPRARRPRSRSGRPTRGSPAVTVASTPAPPRRARRAAVPTCARRRSRCLASSPKAPCASVWIAAGIVPRGYERPRTQVSARPRVDRDLAGADHLDQAERAHHALEGLDLLGRPGDLDDDRRARLTSTTLPRKISRDSASPRPRCAPSTASLNSASSRATVSVGLEVADLQHVDQLVQLLGDLVDRVQRTVERQRDARDRLVVGRADRRACRC